MNRAPSNSSTSNVQINNIFPNIPLLSLSGVFTDIARINLQVNTCTVHYGCETLWERGGKNSRRQDKKACQKQFMNVPNVRFGPWGESCFIFYLESSRGARGGEDENEEEGLSSKRTLVVTKVLPECCTWFVVFLIKFSTCWGLNSALSFSAAAGLLHPNTRAETRTQLRFLPPGFITSSLGVVEARSRSDSPPPGDVLRPMSVFELQAPVGLIALLLCAGGAWEGIWPDYL